MKFFQGLVIGRLEKPSEDNPFKMNLHLYILCSTINFKWTKKHRIRQGKIGDKVLNVKDMNFEELKLSSTKKEFLKSNGK